MTDIMDDAIKHLKKRKLFGWKLFRRISRKSNLYVTKNFKVQNYLEAYRDDIDMTVYKKFGKQIGDSTVSLVTEDDINKKISEAVILSSNSKKKAFTLPAKRKRTTNVKLADSKIASYMKLSKADKLTYSLMQKAHSEFKKHKDIILNEMEIHLTHNEVTVINSKGLSDNFDKTRVFVHAIITAKKGKKEMEFLEANETCRIQDFNIQSFMKHAILCAKDALNAIKTESFEGPVVLTDKAISEFFAPILNLNPVVFHASAKVKFMGISRYTKGKAIVAAKNQKTTIISNPLLSYNTGSAPFDDEGVISLKTKLIDKGGFKSYHSSKRYADYLKMKPTGGLGTIQILPGNKPLPNKTRFEILSFASFVPNFISGDFSAEIRLGYFVSKGKRIPVRGGMFTGNVFSLLENVSYSRKVISAENYHGPNAVMFHNAVIAGL